MTAEIVSIGNELMDGFTVDTHAATLSRILAECGVDCEHRQTVRDDWPVLLAALEEALSRSDVVITIGGLGPTGDDLTREAIAEAMGEQLVVDEEFEPKLKKFFEDRGFSYTEPQRKQAKRPEHGVLIDNPYGTAPGVMCEKNGKIAIAMPGPRGEFVPMAEGFVKDFLSQRASGSVIVSRTLRLCGIGESQAETQIKDLMYGEPRIAPYAQVGEVHFRITAKAKTKEEGLKAVVEAEAKVRERLGEYVYGIDKTTLEQAILELLKNQNASIAVAESITGGAMGERISSVAGASEVFLGGVISYVPAVKESLLGVKHETLEGFTPVSEQVAREMAEGVRSLLKSTYAISLTGNAGPTSDVGGRPIGIVYIAVAGPNGTTCTEHKIHGTREDIRRRSTQNALVMLRNILIAKS